MTVEEAIIDIGEVSKLDCHVKYPEWQEALTLGIEALKRLAHNRDSRYRYSTTLLPGETKK